MDRAPHTNTRALPLCWLALGLLLTLPPWTGARVAMAGDPTPLDKAARLIDHSDWEKQIKGLDLLPPLGRKPAVEALALEALKSSDWAVQIFAAETLVKVGGKAAQKALVRQAIEGDIQWVRSAAIDALPHFDRARISDRLLHAAKARRKIVERVRALEALAKTATPEHLKKIRTLTKNKDGRVSAAAVDALGSLIDNEAARPVVVKSLTGLMKLRSERKYFLTYMAAIRGLGRLDRPEIRTLLLDELGRQADEDAYLPERVARILERMQAEGVATSLNTAIPATRKWPARVRLVRLAGRVRARGTREVLVQELTHKQERIRSAAALALGQIGDPASTKALEERLSDPSAFVRIEAITALRRLHLPEAFRALGTRIQQDQQAAVRLQFVVDVAELMEKEGVEALVPFTKDKSWRVQTAAIVSVGTLGEAKHLPLLIPFAESRDWKVRGAAFEAFGRLRALASIPRLIEGLADKDPIVKGVCLSNLQILSSKRLGTKAKLWLRWWKRDGSKLVLKKRSHEPKPDAEDAEVKEPDVDERYADPARRYGRGKPKDRGIDILRKARILVIKGAWDKVEVVLQHLRIPHTPLRAQELKSVGLNPNQIVLVNCEGNMDKRTVERVQWFVNIGGYLMSTDWALTKAIRTAFPGYIVQYARSSTGNDVVVVENAAPHHPLLAGVFDQVPALKWWLEIQAFPITITYPERCQVLVDSGQMRQRYGTSPMAAVFRWGLGKVQHSISHFYLQEEGMQHLSRGLERRVFAADNLGLSLDQIRKVDRSGGFDGALNDATMKEIAPDYSMFRLIVNMVREKKDWVENL